MVVASGRQWRTSPACCTLNHRFRCTSAAKGVAVAGGRYSWCRNEGRRRLVVRHGRSDRGACCAKYDLLCKVGHIGSQILDELVDTGYRPSEVESLALQVAEYYK